MSIINYSFSVISNYKKTIQTKAKTTNRIGDSLYFSFVDSNQNSYVKFPNLFVMQMVDHERKI